MTHDSVTIGCGSSCGSCRIEESERLLHSGKTKYMSFDRLAERTTAEMLWGAARGNRAFCPEMELYASRLFHEAARRGTRLVTNAGGEDVEGALAASVEVLTAQGKRGTRVAGVIPQDDVLELVRTVNPVIEETGRPYSELADQILGASAYYSARGIQTALEDDADVVITGRVGDSALYMAPLAHHFGWSWDDWDRMAKGLVVGHLLECGPQLSGGYYAAPPIKLVPNLARVGLPYAEVSADGTAVFTKLEESGGKVTGPIVKEQLLYEVGNPHAYLHTDVTVDISKATVTEVGQDRVRVDGVGGRPYPDTVKVLMAAHNGYVGECSATFAGSDSYERAQLAAEVLRERIDILGLDVLDYQANFLGVSSVFTPWEKDPVVPREVTVQLMGRFGSQADAKRFVDDAFIGAGSHYGPAGGTVGRTMAPIEPMPALYSAYIDRSLFKDPAVQIVEV